MIHFYVLHLIRWLYAGYYHISMWNVLKKYHEMTSLSVVDTERPENLIDLKIWTDLNFSLNYNIFHIININDYNQITYVICFILYIVRRELLRIQWTLNELDLYIVTYLYRIWTWHKNFNWPETYIICYWAY